MSLIAMLANSLRAKQEGVLRECAGHIEVMVLPAWTSFMSLSVNNAARTSNGLRLGQRGMESDVPCPSRAVLTVTRPPDEMLPSKLTLGGAEKGRDFMPLLFLSICFAYRSLGKHRHAPCRIHICGAFGGTSESARWDLNQSHSIGARPENSSVTGWG